MRQAPLSTVAGAAALMILSCSVGAFTPQSTPGPSTTPRPDDRKAPPSTEREIDGLPLRQQMVMIQAALSRIASDVDDESRRAEALEEIEALQLRIIQAKRAAPPRFGALDDAAQARHDMAYRALLADMLGEVAKMESAMLEGSAGEVRASLSRLAEFRERGHATFQPPRKRAERPKVELENRVELTAAERHVYVGAYEFKEVGFRVTVTERDGELFLETFGQPAERLYSMGNHRFQIAVAVGAEFRFDVSDEGVAEAIILDPGGDRPEQRIERVR
ncbi:MAG: hypothetical protein ACYTGC_15340 [Planctomycetota bacterium]|jgi:hypothetical protein